MNRSFSFGLRVLALCVVMTKFCAPQAIAQEEAAERPESAPDAGVSTAFPDPPVGVATESTRAANAAVRGRLPFSDEEDFELAQRGFLAKIEDDLILNEDGTPAWQVTKYDFLEGEAPDTVNPSLWRQSKLNSIHGLFEVVDGIYQLRGYDLSVMTLIRGESGWIVIDPLISPAVAKASFELAQRTLGERPITGVIFTHSHVDHFGGVRGLISEEEIEARDVPVLAPKGFTEEAVSENVMAGNAMVRRSMLMFGQTLGAGETGHVGTGLGQAVSFGPVGFIHPTREIGETGTILEIDGVTFEFMDAAGTEAPAEFMFYLPEFKAFCSAEVVTRNFHNVLTSRGAKVRDALAWSKVIDEALVRYGDKSAVLFASHHWPVWGGEALREHLRLHRDNYRYVHDQTLRLANSGETPVEIAEQLAEPDFASREFSVRGYYGTLNHNSKAVYQRYFGWWDGVPANYYALPPVEEGRRYVEYMGGSDAVLKKAQVSFEAGDYRWTAKVLNHLVFAEPENESAKAWLAASYEQLGFQAESGSWRNYFLTAAKELRDGIEDLPDFPLNNPDFVRAIPTETLFDAIAARYDPSKMRRDPFIMMFDFPDTGEKVTLFVGKSVAFPRMGGVENPTVTLTVSRKNFDALLVQTANPQQLMAEGEMVITGEAPAAFAYLLALDQFQFWFNVVTP